MMKNEWEEQLKKRWDAASIEEFDMTFDIEALWKKIDKPAAKPKVKRMLPVFRYAAAVALGALVSWALLRNERKESTLVAHTMVLPAHTRKVADTIPGAAIAVPVLKAERKAAVRKVSVAATGPATRGEDARPQRTLRDPLPPTGYGPKAVKEGPVASGDGVNTVRREVQKTIHISDLEKDRVRPADRNNGIIKLFAKRTEQSTDDMAVSTRIINNQF